MTTLNFTIWTINLVIFGLCLFGGWRLGTRAAQFRAARDRIRPPVNVRLVLFDGREVPVDSVLSPIHTWHVIVPDGIDRSDIAGLEIEKMPPFTEIVIGHA